MSDDQSGRTLSCPNCQGDREDAPRPWCAAHDQHDVDPACPTHAEGRVQSPRVMGHGLRHEGRPVLDRACCGTEMGHGQRNYYDQHGHGECACGAMSPHEDTTAARQRWHRQHKEEVSRG